MKVEIFSKNKSVFFFVLLAFIDSFLTVCAVALVTMLSKRTSDLSLLLSAAANVCKNAVSRYCIIFDFLLLYSFFGLDVLMNVDWLSCLKIGCIKSGNAF